MRNRLALARRSYTTWLDLHRRSYTCTLVITSHRWAPPGYEPPRSYQAQTAIGKRREFLMAQLGWPKETYTLEELEALYRGHADHASEVL